MNVIRRGLSLTLILVLIVTSGAMAAARGQSGGTGSMIICAGQGPVVVTVDADGQPVDAAHICPDCALGLFAAAAAAMADTVRPTGHTLLEWSAEPATHRTTGISAANARAPPRV